MHNSLSRIEREYILRSFREDLPCLTVIVNGSSFSVATYRLDGTTIVWDSDGSCRDMNGPARVSFTHKKKTMFFSTSITSGDTVCTCMIAQEIFPVHKAEEGLEDCILFPDIPGTRHAVYRHPFERVSRNLTLTAEYPSGLQTLASRAGITPDGRCAVPFLASYLERVRSGAASLPSEEDAGHILFADHQRFLVSLPAPCTRYFQQHTLFRVQIQFRQRYIQTRARCAGILPVTGDISIITAEFGTLQEEDKRFLFEHRYTEKYTGTE